MDYVYAVYKERSFSRAAERLYISQPALSAMIKKTESKIGMPLFDRTTSPIRLTECGERYIRTAEKIMDLEEDFAHYVGKLNDLRTGSISIGGTYLFSAFVMLPIIKEFSKRFPLVNVSVFEGHTSLLEQKLFDGELDMIVDNYLLDESVYQKNVFMQEHLLLAVPTTFKSNQGMEKYQLSSKEIQENKHLDPDFPGVPLKHFETDPYLLLRLHNDSRQRVERICERADVKLNVTMKLNQLLTTYHLTEEGMGNSFVSDTVVKSQPVSKKIIYYKLSDSAATRQVYLYYKKNKHVTRSMEEFMKLALHTCEKQTPDPQDSVPAAKQTT